jgi:hypothetical protein
MPKYIRQLPRRERKEKWELFLNSTIPGEVLLKSLNAKHPTIHATAINLAQNITNVYS